MPTVLCVVFGQLVTKWRVGLLKPGLETSVTMADRLFVYLKDPWILAAYSASFMASVAWMFVIEAQDVSIAFPLYIGMIVCLVGLGGTVFFGEAMTPLRLLATVLIVLGVVVGSRA